MIKSCHTITNINDIPSLSGMPYLQGLICHSLRPKSSLLTCVMAVHSTNLSNHALTAVIMILKDRNSLYAIRVGGFMIAAQFCTNKVSRAHMIYVLITNVINTYALVNYIIYIINMCPNKVISLSLSLYIKIKM